MKAKRAILLEAVSSGRQAAGDKQSMPEQDERLREIAAQMNWQIIDIIAVPGHSRVYYTYREFAEDALLEGIPGPMRMFEHWQNRDFDVFACVSGDRFGREQSIFAEVVGRTIDAGAVVYTLRDGEINSGNKRMFVSMGGYQASTEIDELKRRHKFGMNRRAAEGLPISSRILFSHRAVRDPLGNATALVVRDELRPLFADVASVLLDRVAWHSLEKVLFARYGHVGQNGKPYPPRFFHPILNAPVFWGNNARNFFNNRSPNLHHRGMWMFDDSTPAPDGVLIYYGTHEAVYTGELGEAVKAELRRRMSLRGSARPDSDYPLSGMFQCQECGNKLAWINSHGKWRAARCNTAYQLKPSPKTCSQRTHMPERYALDYMRHLFGLIVEAGEIEAALASFFAAPAEPDETPLLERQLAQFEDEARILIQKQLRAPASMSALYDEQMDVLGARLDGVKARLELVKRTQPSASERDNQRAAISEIAEQGDAFWHNPPGQINQTLRRALGKRVFVVEDGKICGSVRA